MIIGVPPGVGDTYWALCKLEAFRAHHNLEKVTLAVQHSSYERATPWAGMVDFVDEAYTYKFRSTEAEKLGISWNARPLDCVLWPNAVLDRGEMLSTWMPKLKLNQDFKIHTTPADRYIVVYASSEAINRSWAPNLGHAFWRRLIWQLAEAYDLQVAMIGAQWDKSFCNGISGPYIDFVAKTDLPTVAGILENAALVIGIISGMTILANHFKRPTIAIYPPKFHPKFPYTWIPEGAPYRAIKSTDVTRARIVTMAEAIGNI